MGAPRLRVAVVTLGDPEWLHALAEPFNKTLRDRGLSEHCRFLRLPRPGRVKGLTATLHSYILGGTGGCRATVVILDRHVHEVYRRIDAVKRRYAGHPARGGKGASNPVTYYSVARFVVVRDAATMDLLHPCSMETEASARPCRSCAACRAWSCGARCRGRGSASRSPRP